MTASTLRAAPSGRAAGLRPQPPAGSSRSSIPAAQDAKFGAFIRANNIVGVHWDPLLDRFTVHLRDYSCGGGATVGEALAKAKRRAA